MLLKVKATYVVSEVEEDGSSLSTIKMNYAKHLFCDELHRMDGVTKCACPVEEHICNRLCKRGLIAVSDFQV